MANQSRVVRIIIFSDKLLVPAAHSHGVEVPPDEGRIRIELPIAVTQPDKAVLRSNKMPVSARGQPEPDRLDLQSGLGTPGTQHYSKGAPNQIQQQL